MEPVTITPEALAKQRFTSKVNKPRNIQLVGALKSSSQAIRNAIAFLKTGHSLDDANGTLLDAWGEQYAIPRDGLKDDEYRELLRAEQQIPSVSSQSRPSVGAYIRRSYGTEWIAASGIGAADGATGAFFNRVPLRAVFAQFGSMAPDIVVPASVVSATFAADVYSSATPANIRLTNHAPMFPGGAFPAVWGGLQYERTKLTLRATATAGLRITTTKSLQLRMEGVSTIENAGLVEPFNTLPTVKAMGVKENG